MLRVTFSICHQCPSFSSPPPTHKHTRTHLPAQSAGKTSHVLTMQECVITLIEEAKMSPSQPLQTLSNVGLSSSVPGCMVGHGSGSK